MTITTKGGTSSVTSIRNLNPSSPSVSISGSIIEITVGSVDSNDLEFSISNIQNPSQDNSNFFLIETYDQDEFKIDYVNDVSKFKLTCTLVKFVYYLKALQIL